MRGRGIWRIVCTSEKILATLLPWLPTRTQKQRKDKQIIKNMTDVLGFRVIFRPLSALVPPFHLRWECARHAQKSLGKTSALRAHHGSARFGMHVLGTGWYAFRFVGVVLARLKSARPLYFSAGHSKQVTNIFLFIIYSLNLNLRPQCYRKPSTQGLTKTEAEKALTTYIPQVNYTVLHDKQLQLGMVYRGSVDLAALSTADILFICICACLPRMFLQFPSIFMSFSRICIA